MSNSRPWDDWIPGVLSRRQVEQLRDEGFLRPPNFTIDPRDESSFDLTLTGQGWQMIEGSVKPSKSGYLTSLQDRHLVQELRPNDDGHYRLTRGQTYLFKVKESLVKEHIPEMAAAQFHAQATARSSVGRIDVLARLVVDGSPGYEGFEAEHLKHSTGEMFLEITPISFNVLVREGVALSQLRLFYGRPDDVQIRGGALCRTAIRAPNGGMADASMADGSLSVDLSATRVGKMENVVAFSPKRVEKPVKLWNPIDYHEEPQDPREFWERVQITKNKRLEIETDKFYILRSRELMRMPLGVAVYCRASDETLGEMRIHYAGFVHPKFGRNRKDNKPGTPLIFEVRGHNFKVALEDGEKMARLLFYRLSADAPQDSPLPLANAPSGPVVRSEGEHMASPSEAKQPAYNDQILKLSSFFPDWPEDD